MQINLLCDIFKLDKIIWDYRNVKLISLELLLRLLEFISRLSTTSSRVRAVHHTLCMLAINSALLVWENLSFFLEHSCNGLRSKQYRFTVTVRTIGSRRSERVRARKGKIERCIMEKRKLRSQRRMLEGMHVYGVQLPEQLATTASEHRRNNNLPKPQSLQLLPTVTIIDHIWESNEVAIIFTDDTQWIDSFYRYAIGRVRGSKKENLDFGFCFSFLPRFLRFFVSLLLDRAR